MGKPATLLQREFKEKIIESINNSSLPAFVLIPILEHALEELKAVDEAQYKADLAEYEKENKENGEDT